MADNRAILEKVVRDRATEIAITATRLLETRLKEAAPVSKPGPGRQGANAPGRLRKSIFTSLRPGPTEFVIRAEARAAHASFPETGTRPHVIRARRAQVLYFFWPRGYDGARFYAFGHVNHPGTPRTLWWSKTLATMPRIWEEASR